MSSFIHPVPPRLSVLALIALSFVFAAPGRAFSQTVQTTAAEQEQQQQQPTPEATPEANAASAAEMEAAQKRLSRARSLAAIGKLAAAASELESLRSSTKDESVGEVTRVLLMAIFVEMPDYTRAGALLDEAFKARGSAQPGDAATHSYFALAGQTVNAVRTHLERYRSFGVNVSDATELTPDAASDIDQLRGLLERVVTQARALHEEQSKGGADGSKGLDAAALLEDAATVRMRLARHDEDRARWQSEVSEARQQLFSSEMRIASISEIPAARTAAAQPTPAAKSAAPAATNTKAAAPGPAQPARTETKSSDAVQKSSKRSRTQPVEQTARNAAPSAPAPTQPQGGTSQPSGNASQAPAGGGGPVSVGSLVSKARQRSAPAYPPIARAGRISGNVTVFLIVNEKGDVESISRADGPAQLQQAAIEAARRWKFNPTVIDGQTVRVSGYLTFNFTL
ncbi:MAG TPA: TonB family protein [Pyrinomonadaceae bacterium]|nr:TonB family protein [Pyrinomonadaceae bacterium]